MPIKDKDLWTDQHKQAEENSVDVLAKQAAHEAAIEAKGYEVFSPNDYAIKLKNEQKKKRTEAEKQRIENINAMRAKRPSAQTLSGKVVSTVSAALNKLVGV